MTNVDSKKLKLHSPDFTDQNIARLAELFPNCVTESRDESGNIKRAIDFDQLRQELADHLVEGPQERYHLNWPGKREALIAANAPVAKTFRPSREESQDFDNTQNLFIEGDNLDALKLLQESYLNSVKMIYVDPPYNTGNDFIYEDNFSESTEEYFKKSKQKDDYGNRLISNTESNGRYHSDWLTMMYSRIRLARNLLRDNGLLFISISDEELSNLKSICDEIFGERNRVGIVEWNSTKSVTNTALISVGHTHNLVYAKSLEYFVRNRSHFRLSESGEGFSNPDNDPRGPWKADPFQVGGERPNQRYEIVNPQTGEKYKPNPGCSWKNDYERFQELLADNRIVFGASGEAGPQRKRFLSEANERGRVAKTWWDDVGTTTNGTREVKDLFDGWAVFSNPKPVDLIRRMIELGDHTGSGIVMDFFAGSCTTAEAVLAKNAEDGGGRRFIMVQLPEPCDAPDEFFGSRVETIADIGKERIRRAGRKILEEGEGDKKLDIGFRLLKVDSSNMKDVYYSPDEVTQEDLEGLTDNIKEDRSEEDLLFQVLVDWGVDLSLPIETESISGKTVYFVEENVLAACFSAGVDEDLVKELAERKPLRAVFRDTAFDYDSTKINVEQIFHQYSPHTEVKSI